MKIFKKKNTNNEDLITKRSWKKIIIWSSVSATLVAGLIPAIYFPIVLNKKHHEPMPKLLVNKSLDGLIDVFEENTRNDEIWGFYIDVKDNSDSDFAIFGQEEEGEIDKSDFDGPFSHYLADTSMTWYSFYDIDSDDSTEQFAKFIYEVYRTGKEDDKPLDSGTSYYNVDKIDDDDSRYDDLNKPDKQKTVNVELLDKNSDGEEEEKYSLTYNDGATTVLGPIWLGFKGDNLILWGNTISRESGSSTKKADFKKFEQKLRDFS